MDDHHTNETTVHTNFQKIGSAIFYGISSILVIFSNKAVMTYYHFYYFDFLATTQFLVTCSILFILHLMKKIDIPPLNFTIFKEILPVSLMFLGNVLCGLGSTKSLNIPLFTALRRFSIFLTMLGEWYLLKARPSASIMISVSLMVGGAVIAALYDLKFDAQGYFLVFLNNIFTALNGVYMKKASISGKCSKMGVLFYNSLFSGMIMSLYFALEHMIQASDVGVSLRPSEGTTTNHTTTTSTLSEIFANPHWSDPIFILMFFAAASMGSILNYSIFLCTTINSPLTTAVVGATKNVATTYIGMFAFDDYTFSWLNFLGLNVSIAGSLYYTYMILFKGAVGFGNT